MNRIAFIFLASLLSCPFLFAEDTGTNAAEKIVTIGTTNANLFYNQTATVTGKVAQVTFREKVVFVNLDRPFPDSPFTGVIFSANTNEFTDLPNLKGKNVEITGTIKNYNDKPEVILTNASQLKITGQ